ncbi:zinc ribbon domain-containing protein [Anaerosphaera multitolerans]|uniref:zinc ribbon domain-containing protein n=1 Tax=Anaerosphaera multitolerans TaxID=2487351 RepID=UPI0013E36D44|nr:zinc ribbon domain-containing protein [Anaerosphaera multitolerans]
MFCSNCGSKVSPSDNYCPVCGKNLKNVKISIVEENQDKKDNTKVKLDDSTKIFKPITTLDGIDTTDDIKNIIKAVDEKISQNISEYEKKVSSTENLYGPDKRAPKDLTDTFSKVSTDDFKSKNIKDNKIPTKSDNKTDSINGKTKDEIVAKNQIDKDKIKKPKTQIPKKKGLKSLWKDFINEDDDEFSIFSSLEEKKPLTKEEDIELLSSTSSNRSMENTLDIPKVAIEKALEESEKEKSESINPESKNSISYKSFTEQVNEEIKKKEEDKPKETDSKKESFLNKFSLFKKKDNKKITEHKDEEKKKIPTKNSKDSLRENAKEIKEPIQKSVSQTKQSSSTFKKAFYKFISFISEKLLLFESTLNSKNKEYFKTLFIISAVLSSLPIIISMKRISFGLLVLIVLKLVFSFLKYYVSLNVATDKDWTESSEEEVRNFSFINWLVCEIFLFIAFIFSPWYGFFSFSLLSSLIAFPIATIFLFILSPLIAVALYWKQLKNKSKVNFVAWYLIPFILLDFISKFIFILVDLFM